MEEIFILTKDKIKIGLNYYKNGFDNVIIIAPGWCMTKDSQAFKLISESFLNYFDVITFDFRGHGKSSGWYTFTAKEEDDLEAVINFSKTRNYQKIFLLGFSLGAEISVNYACKYNNIDKVIAVSVPSSFNKIENHMWKKEAWYETFKKFEFNRFLSIRPFPIPLKKDKPIDLIKNLKVPTLFMAGDKDPTVYSWHTEKLYNLANCDKDYIIFKNGYHAEDLFLYHKNEFSKYCINWFLKK